jgi:hypothetical protein
METRFSSFKAAFIRAMEALCTKINSSHFAAAQRRRALSGLDSRQLADIGLIYVDGDYRPHPGAMLWRPEAAPDNPKAKPVLAVIPRGAVSP